jgi:hypothetical protein
MRPARPCPAYLPMATMPQRSMLSFVPFFCIGQPCQVRHRVLQSDRSGRNPSASPTCAAAGLCQVCIGHRLGHGDRHVLQHGRRAAQQG